MPTRALHSCNAAGCPALTAGRYCERHERASRQRTDRDRGSSSKRGYGATWRRLRKMVLARDPICRACHRKASTDADHIVSKRCGGEDTLENLQGLCHACHAEKTAREDNEWGR